MLGAPPPRRQRMLRGFGCRDEPRDAQRGGGAGGAGRERDTQVGCPQSGNVAKGCGKRRWLPEQRGDL